MKKERKAEKLEQRLRLGSVSQSDSSFAENLRGLLLLLCEVP